MTTQVTVEEIKERCADPGMVSYCGMMMRPGIHGWLTELEYTMFKPDTDANDGFHLAIMKWPADIPPPIGLYAVATFEKRAQIFAESILWKHGLRKVTEGYTQMVIGGKAPEENLPVDIAELRRKGSLEFTVGPKAPNIQKFPITGPNVFFLENHSKGAPNVIYTNDPVKMRVAWEHEMKQTQKFFDEHKRWLETEEGKAIADAYWAKHPEGRVE